MAGLNKVMIIGNLGKDPEVRYTPNALAVASMTIATSESWKDKQTGEKKELVEWHNVVLYNKLAEIAGKYLRKGSKIFIEGKLATKKWQDKTTGQERYKTEIVANALQMLDGKSNKEPVNQAAEKPQEDFIDDDCPF